jgi:monoterpene epsilon-lactone hydrolase
MGINDMNIHANASHGSNAAAQTAAQGTREVPARTVPVPDTVSPQMKVLIGAPPSPTWNVIPKTAAEWKAQIDAAGAAVMSRLPALREALRVKVEPMTIDGVKVHMVTPQAIAPENQNRLLVHVHGGCFMSFPGESGTLEAILMSGFGRFRVISIDYRMPPDHPYPAALDDAMTVWKRGHKNGGAEKYRDLRHVRWRQSDLGHDLAGQAGQSATAWRHCAGLADVRP